MTIRKSRCRVNAIVMGTATCLAAGHFPFCHADVTSSGLGTVVTQPATGTFEITGGTRPGGGTNLFHSFGNFSLDAGQSGNFINDSGLATKNILSRVTGGNPSNIYGTIDTSNFPGANLFLMNPAGILFGPGAQLNVDGSFHATTADYIKLGNDGGVFYADPSQSSSLSVAAPTAFGFLSTNPAAIDVNSSDFLIGAQEQTLSFVGGPINVGEADGSAPGYVVAPGGQVNLVSVASPGEAAFDDTGIDVADFSQLGPVTLQGSSIVDGKNVFIRGGQLTVDDAIIFPNVFYFFGVDPPVDGGEVNIQVADSVTITGTGPDPLTDSPPGIFVFSGDFFAIPTAPGKVPDVNITANSVSISGFAGIQSDRLGPGDPGDITINADTVDISNGGSVALFNAWQGPGGNLTINARNLTMSGDGSPSAVGFEGIGAQGLFNPLYGDSVDPELTFADSGNIKVNLTGDLNIKGQASITTDSLNFGTSGNIDINAQNITLVGSGAETGAIAAQSAFMGDAGDITINASALDIQGGFRISSSSIGAGNGGDVVVNAGDSITLTGADSRITALTFPPPTDTLNTLFQSFLGMDFESLRVALNECCGLPLDADQFAVLDTLNQLGYTAVTDFTPGNAGTITINTPVLTLNTDTRLTTSTGWDGDAGAVNVDVASLFLKNGGLIESASGTQTLTGDVVVGTGNAGSVNISASDSISIAGASSRISTSTLGDGNAGDVSLNAGQIDIEDGGSISSASGGTVNGQSYVGSGNAGTVMLSTTGPLTISGSNSTLSTTTRGTGAGGDIKLDSRGNVEISNGGSVTSESTSPGSDAGNAGDITISSGNKINLDGGTISTRTVNSAGGFIDMTAPKWVYLLNSEITTSVANGPETANGGDITIDPEFIILNHSNILANAYEGKGGNINLVADWIFRSTDSRVDASSALGINGTVNQSSPDQDVSKELAVLPENFLDVSGLINDRCGDRAGASSLVPVGPGGLTVDPDGYLPSFGTMNDAVYHGTGKSSAIHSGQPLWALNVDTSALQLADFTCAR